MITPLEIENKEFSKAVRGYKAEEVDEFLDEIILDLQALLAEREQLKAQVEKLNQDLVQYKKSESSVINTLESAKKLMNDRSESAENGRRSSYATPRWTPSPFSGRPEIPFPS